MVTWKVNVPFPASLSTIIEYSPEFSVFTEYTIKDDMTPAVDPGITALMILTESVLFRMAFSYLQVMESMG